MQPHQQRVVDEKKELDLKREKLADFMLSPTYAQIDRAEQARLNYQAEVMTAYSNILGRRITAFAPEAT